MDSPYHKAFFLILLLEAIAGFLSSSFMILCLSSKEFRRQNMTTYVKILILLNVSNICYISTLSTNFIFGFFWPGLYMKPYVYFTVMFTTLYSITSYLWLSSSLCVFFFMKIVPSRPGVLRTLKGRIDAVVWWLTITSEVVSLGGSFLSMLLSPQQTNQGNSSITTSELIEETKTENVKLLKILLALISLPFLVIVVTMIGSAGFLKLYNHQIQKKMTTSGSTRVRDYRSAIQTMMGLLVLYVSILLFQITTILNVFSDLSLCYCLCVILLFLCVTILPAHLICGNPKLKETIRRMFTL